MKLVISCLFLAIAAAACSSASVDTGTDQNDLKGVCDPLKCPANEHFSTKKCKCVADCTEMWACTTNEHWDADACKCVASCTEMWMCTANEHWDSSACKCVPDIAPATN